MRCRPRIVARSCTFHRLRHRVVDDVLMPSHVVVADASSPAVRSAACGAVQSLSRSAKDLRGELCEPAVAAALCRLLRDPTPAVQSAAIDALCNVVLEFSLLKVRCVPIALDDTCCQGRNEMHSDLIK